MYQNPLNPQQLFMLGQSQNNPQQQQQLLNTFSLMNYASPAQYFANQESQLPSYLQLGASVGAPEGMAARQSFMQNTAKPSNAAARSGEQKYGGSGNSFAVQRTAAQRAANAAQASSVEQEARNAELQRVMAMRQSFMGMPGGQDGFASLAMPQQVSDSSGIKSVGSVNGGPSSMERGLSVAKGVDNLLGGVGSQLLGNLGNNIGQGVGRFMTSPANPLSGLFGRGGY